MEKLAILDCGGQYTKVIDRRIREAGVYTDIFPMGVTAEKLRGYGAIILSGGPASVWDCGAPVYDKGIFALGVPMLGICYGMQLIVEHFGGSVRPHVKTEYGQVSITVDPSCPLFAGLKPDQRVLMSHGDAVEVMPDGFSLVAQTGSICAGVWDAARRIVGVQFHPEVDPTENGTEMLEHFVRGIAGFTEQYALEDRVATSVAMIRRRVGDSPVVVLVSGGVDSAVTAALLLRALPSEQVYAVHIDHGLMRKNESDLICRELTKLGLVHLRRLNVEDEFFGTSLTIDGEELLPLSETCEPERKRAIIGQMFFRVTEEAMRDLRLDFDRAFLAQGTLRPDLIESGNPDVSGYAHKIKTHHNDVGIIRVLRDRGRVVETNWDWHKDEVRRVARMLGLAPEICARQPFPGPGLGVRILCGNAGMTALDVAGQESVRAFADTVAALRRKIPGTDKLDAVIAPVRSVGVQGDNRSYRLLSVLYGCGQAGETGASPDALFAIAREIPNQCDAVNRVAYLIDRPAPGGTLTSTRSRVCHEEAELLRTLDAIVTEELVRAAIDDKPRIAQSFAVLLPVIAVPDTAAPAAPAQTSCTDLNNAPRLTTELRYSVAIRAVVTSDFMTAASAVPGRDFAASALPAMVARIRREAPEIDMIFYDVTGKPPATVEWE